MASKHPTFPQVKTALDLKYIWYLTTTIRSKVYESVRVCEKRRGMPLWPMLYPNLWPMLYRWKEKNKWHAGKSLIPKNQQQHLAMDQYLLIPFLGGWTSINPSYFDVNYRGTRFWHTAIWFRGSPSHVKSAIAPCCHLKSMKGDRLARSGAGNPSKTYWLDRVIQNL